MAADAIPGERRLNYHPARDQLLAEAHARPYTPLPAPMLVTRLATLTGQQGADIDRAHMVALCRRLGQAEPSPDSRWCALDAGGWQLRWERHTEFSTWTFFRAPVRPGVFAEAAIDAAPKDWVDALPGEVLVAANLEVRAMDSAPSPFAAAGSDAIGARLMRGLATVYTDFRADAQGMTRFLLLDASGDPPLVGRVARSLLEIETYRLMALLAFPLAGEATKSLTGIEAEAATLAGQLAEPADPSEDRRLLDRLANLAGEAEALSARTSFRFGAAAAYHDLVRDRIASLQEEQSEGMQTIGEFMERRLAPAMRTCATVAERERAAIERIARTEQMLNTRVEVAAEATSAALLASMDRRAKQQLRLQRTVEGLSVAAIAYYALGLLLYALKALEHVDPRIDATLAAGVSMPFVIAAVWLSIRRLRARLGRDDET
jgi:uncharacterized membrane-anchored protein